MKEILHNLREDELLNFDRERERHAEKTLPRWKKSRAHTLEKARNALPNGIVEERCKERYSIIGKQARRVSRGLGNKGHS